MTLEEFKKQQQVSERAFVRSKLVMNGWRLSRAAESLGLAPTSLLTTIKRLGINDEYQRRNPGRGKR